MHKKYSQQGLAVVGFPCNQFGNQEPGTNLKIKEFCTSKYDVTFDMFAKIKVNGKDACGLYKHLKSIAPTPKGEGDVSWNFEKIVKIIYEILPSLYHFYKSYQVTTPNLQRKN